ncbi:hypothetical protein [Synechococcus sp. 1G10]|uniref:hypothetical protein n=1 Tax=Synechococcus sp. 1G10 TaxID=2025605 RepID=UPI0013036081|nr:hypothetical protein [Synechococcus sp. 1G10]
MSLAIALLTVSDRRSPEPPAAIPPWTPCRSGTVIFVLPCSLDAVTTAWDSLIRG